jgi:hypothetical protein
MRCPVPLFPSHSLGIPRRNRHDGTAASSGTPTRKTMPTNRNMLYLVIGALCVAVVGLGYKVYQDNKEPKGIELKVGPGGVSIEKK